MDILLKSSPWRLEVRGTVVVAKYAWAAIFLVLVSGCRAQNAASAPTPAPSVAPMMGFGVPVGMLPVNVVGSYGGGTSFAQRAGAGKHPLPSGIGVPVPGSSARQSTWACMVLLYGSGAAVQYEGMGHCGTGKQPSGEKRVACEIPLPRENAAMKKGRIGIGWCAPDKRPKPSQK